ncbi:hypothetical protein C8J57DRAFT_1529384 [Mycena rebaudengoi]|nr:hypothetical protein C8J57DRAFT_1529384 [Mycena rebaudengoi]
MPCLAHTWDASAQLFAHGFLNVATRTYSATRLPVEDDEAAGPAHLYKLAVQSVSAYYGYEHLTNTSTTRPGPTPARRTPHWPVVLTASIMCQPSESARLPSAKKCTVSRDSPSS